MARPRIFISSTCYDLNDIRSELTSYLEKFNFEVLNSQLSNFGVVPRAHSHTACIEQVYNADFFIVIIGKRRGGTFIGSEKSITNEEYTLAVKRGIPVIVCVDKQVDNTLLLYKKNPTSDFSSIVDDNRIFHFVEYIKSSSSDNWVFPFDSIIDIKEIIKTQFSYYLLLFSQRLVKTILKEKTVDSSKLDFVNYPSNIDEINAKKLSQEEETSFRNGLKELHQYLINILTSDGGNDNKLEKLKVLWVIAKYGELNWEINGLEIDNDVFKDYAWGTTKGRRVSNQIKPHGINYEYNIEEEMGKCTIRLDFKNETEDCQIAFALKSIVEDLIKRFGNDDAFELFKKADFRIYMN